MSVSGKGNALKIEILRILIWTGGGALRGAGEMEESFHFMETIN